MMGACLLGGGCSDEASESLDNKLGEELSIQPGNGPFGLSYRAGPSDLDIDPESSTPDTGLYLLNSVPSPASEFETYGAVAFEKVGLCEIRSITPQFSNDSLGSSVTTLADKLADALTSKYGEGEKLDVCGGGSISCQQQFWAMSVMNGERVYGYDWKPTHEHIREINLFVTSDNLAQLSLRLDYKIGDEKACENALNSVRASNL